MSTLANMHIHTPHYDKWCGVDSHHLYSPFLNYFLGGKGSPLRSEALLPVEGDGDNSTSPSPVSPRKKMQINKLGGLAILNPQILSCKFTVNLQSIAPLRPPPFNSAQQVTPQVGYTLQTTTLSSQLLGCIYIETDEQLIIQNSVLLFLPRAHAQGVKQSICTSVVVVGTKIARSRVLGVCAYCFFYPARMRKG